MFSYHLKKHLVRISKYSRNSCGDTSAVFINAQNYKLFICYLVVVDDTP